MSREKPILFSPPMVRALLDGRKTQTRRIVKPLIVEAIEFMGGGADNEPATADSIALHWGAPISDTGKPDKREQWLVSSAEYPEEGCVPIGAGYGRTGDVLWVRERFWNRKPNEQWLGQITYYADMPGLTESGGVKVRWRPSIHMPRWAARLFLRVTAVRVERVQEISLDDCAAEGNQIPVSTDGHILWRISGKHKPVEYLKDGALRAGAPPVSGDDIARAHFASLWDSLNAKRGYSWESNPWVFVYTFERIKP